MLPSRCLSLKHDREKFSGMLIWRMIGDSCLEEQLGEQAVFIQSHERSTETAVWQRGEDECRYCVTCKLSEPPSSRVTPRRPFVC